ncbi:MAG TPA: hypothetical protein VIK18_06010 [Pirellulales bacterium]
MTPSSTAASGPPQGLRTALSFLLFLHLFALTVGVTSNEAASQLETGLRKTPLVVPYLQLLLMDLSYCFNLTFGPSDSDVSDAETWIEADLTTAAGPQQIILPAAGLEPRQRLRRYESLVRTAAAQVGSPSSESLLPAAIARGLLTRHGATGGAIRIVRSSLPSDAFTAFSPTRRTLYEARMIVAAGRVELFKSEAAGESAPVAKP